MEDLFIILMTGGIGFLAWWLTLEGNNDDTSNNSIDKVGFSIEYYPETGRYYPKCGNFYMKKDCNTGIVELREPRSFMWADGFSWEYGARDLIKLYKEQSLKENVHTIKVD